MKNIGIVRGGVVSAIALSMVLGIAAFAFSADTTSAQALMPTCTINASTANQGAGQPVTLTWSSNYATSANLTNVGSVSTSGSQLVYPTVTTTYTLTVTGQGGTANCQTTVYISGTSGNLSCNIYANPSSIYNFGGQNNSTTVTWNSSNATSANLTNVGSVSTNGSQVFYPSSTTTYTLTVYNAQGQSANCQITVTVNTTSSGAPSCWITLSNYNYNQAATLSWGSSNATSANIASIGSVSTSGSQTVYPYANQIYTMTVYNSNGQSGTCQTTQYNQPTTGNLYCSISANPSTIQNSQSSYLTWTSTGATSAWLSDGLGNVAVNGSISVRPEMSRNYTLTVSDYQGRTQTCYIYVTVSGYYPYVNLNQIPYTGFDFGAFGNALYWGAMILFALAAAYMIVYFMPRHFSVGKTRMPAYAHTTHSSAAYALEVPTIFSRGPATYKIPAEKAEVAREHAVVAAEIENLPTAHTEAAESVTSGGAPKDAMSIAESHEGMPRIVVSRN